MNQYQFASLIGVSQPTICDWNKRGYIVRDETGAIDPEASKAAIIAARGSLKPMNSRESSRLSPWRRGPHCATHRAWAVNRGLRDE